MDIIRAFSLISHSLMYQRAHVDDIYAFNVRPNMNDTISYTCMRHLCGGFRITCTQVSQLIKTMRPRSDGRCTTEQHSNSWYHVRRLPLSFIMSFRNVLVDRGVIF